MIDNINDRFSPNEVYGISEEITNSSFNSEHLSAQNHENQVNALIEQY
ncbi:hypothetical protein J6T66_03390 [bacterium]|nr:hypothetical protein [bacterium]